MPVRLISFTAQKQLNSVVLVWQTAKEINNKEFIVLRASNGVDFVPLAHIAPKTNSNQVQNYTYVDKNPENGNNYYQLLQVDLDGKTTNSGLKVLSFDFAAEDVQIYPNPTRNIVNISFAKGKYRQAKLVDLNGRLLQTKPINTDSSKLDFNLQTHSASVYLILLEGDGINKEKLKIIKE